MKVQTRSRLLALVLSAVMVFSSFSLVFADEASHNENLYAESAHEDLHTTDESYNYEEAQNDETDADDEIYNQEDEYSDWDDGYYDWLFNNDGFDTSMTTAMGWDTYETPVAFGFTTTPMIAAGWGQTVALRNDGTVWAWGHNGFGQLGDGTTTARFTPVQLQNLNNVTAIATGSHTVALRNDGTVWAWGMNFHGQLGDGTTTARLTPVHIQNLNNVTAIATGGSHTAVLRNDGTVWTCAY